MEPAAATASSSIFGGAKPVDTAKKEREIEEKLQKQHEEVKSRSRTQSERSGDENNKSNEEEKSSQADPEPPKPPKKSSIFGDAKPVDTTKKEREIEAKLKTIEVDDVKKERPRGGQNIHPENSNDKNHGTVSHQISFQKKVFPQKNVDWTFEIFRVTGSCTAGQKI